MTLVTSILNLRGQQVGQTMMLVAGNTRLGHSRAKQAMCDVRSCEDNAERDKEGIKDQSLRNEHPHLGRKGLGEKETCTERREQSQAGLGQTKRKEI